MSNTTVKTRFCPSPTGLIHLGNTRTALFNALFARREKGIFLLRIEDTDQSRSKQEYVDAVLADLRWLALDWEEGHDVGGDLGPYRQSERQAVYDQYYQRLEGKGWAYPCFCSEEKLAFDRKVQRATGKPPRYPGTCRSLGPDEIAEKIQAGIKPTLRFKIPAGKTIVFHDLVRGTQRFLSDDLGDFIIRRANGTPPFMYCNAIDDATQGVTHALRGEDHLTNTPRQIMILEAVGLAPPQYGHISLILGDDGAPLSKRNGSRSVQELREAGFLPLAIINYLARLGHSYEDNAFMTLDRLAAQFSVDHLGHAPAKFDYNQLLRWQKEAIMQMDTATFYSWMGEESRALVAEPVRDLFFETIRPNVVFPVDVTHWAKIFFTNEINLLDEQRDILRKAGMEFFETALQIVDELEEHFNDVTSTLGKRLNVRGKHLFMPLRIALTGEMHGPELVHIFELLGKERICQRLQSIKNTVLSSC